MNNKGQVMIPIIIPSRPAPPPKKIECPNCHHKFVPPKDDLGLSIIWVFVWLCGVFCGFLWCGISLMGWVKSPEELLGDGRMYSMVGTDKFVGIFILFTLFCLIAGFITSFFDGDDK